MKLSAEQFAELASSFGAVESAQKHERRRATRMELHARVTISTIVESKRSDSLQVAICDFSARGISFLHPKPMTAGQQFVTQLPRQAGGNVHLLCTVKHCRPVGDDGKLFRVGAEFTCTINAPLGSPDDSAIEQQISRIRDSMLS
jgi:hypothetical protein